MTKQFVLVGAAVEQAPFGWQTSAAVDAATAFRRTLASGERQKVEVAFTPQKSSRLAAFHRTPDGGGAPGAASSGFGQCLPGGFAGEQYGQAVWSNTQVSDVTRPGIRPGTLTAAQRDAAMRLLQIVLSPMGYQKVREIMGSDQALVGAGTNFASGETVYTIAIFGEPSLDKPWMIEFGGHHLGLNIVFAGSMGLMTPTLTGAELSANQRALLIDVIEQWAGIVNDSYAKPRMAEIQSELSGTFFAWSGPTTHEPGKKAALTTASKDRISSSSLLRRVSEEILRCTSTPSTAIPPIAMGSS